MLRKLAVLIVALATLASSTAVADTFYSGFVDVNSQQTGTMNNTTMASRMVAGSGMSFTNAAGGGIVNAVGYTTITSAQFNNLSQNRSMAGANTSIVAVFALQGNFNADLGPLGVDFTSGQVRLYHVSNFDGEEVTPFNPLSWVGAANASGFLAALGDPIAEFNLASKPDYLQTGDSIGLQNPSGFSGFDNAASTNTAVSQAFPDGSGGSAQILVNYDPSSGTYFDFNGLGYLMDPSNPQLLINVDQSLVSGQGASNGLDSLGPDGLGLLGDIFETFLPGGGQFVPDGDEYDPTNPGLTGDAMQGINGVFAIPGSTVLSQQEVPEPASIIVWGALTAIGGAYGARRRMMAKKA